MDYKKHTKDTTNRRVDRFVHCIMYVDLCQPLKYSYYQVPGRSLLNVLASKVPSLLLTPIGIIWHLASGSVARSRWPTVMDRFDSYFFKLGKYYGVPQTPNRSCTIFFLRWAGCTK
jgi:hypothetical protein